MRGAGDVAAQPQPPEALPAIFARRLGLQPVEDRVRQLGCGLQVACALVLRHVEDRAFQVVDHGPVDEADVRCVGSRHEVAPRRDAAEGPQVHVATALALVGVHLQRIVVGVGREGALHGLQRAWMRRLEAQHRPAPEMRLVGAPVRVVVRLGDGLVALHVVDGKTDRQRLHIAGLGFGRRAGFARVGAALEPDGVLGAGERQQVAGFRGIDHIGCGPP
jgi:hypothetical protein